MRYTQHHTNNVVLGAPPGWDQKGPMPCGALPATKVTPPDAPASFVSYWRATKEEIRALQRGALIELWVIGAAAHPVVAIAVEGVKAE